MSITIKNIELSQIRKENSFRNKRKDKRFKQDIKDNGLLVPLLVEREGQFGYVLVDGYRRYDALIAGGFKTVECIIQPQTTITERIVKRLSKALRPEKKRSPADLKSMIEALKVEGYTVKRISETTGVKIQTIKRYIGILKIDPELLEIADEAGKGYGAAKIIDQFKLDMKFKKVLLKSNLNKEIDQVILKIIGKVTEDTAFESIPSDYAKEFIELKLIKPYLQMKEFPVLIIEEYLTQFHLNVDQTNMDNLLKLLKEIEENDEIHTLKKLSKKQKDDLFKLLIKLISNIYLS